MKIGITGGCGFVGSNLAERFAVAGHDVLVLDNLMRNGSSLNLQRLEKKNNIECVRGDVRNPEDLGVLFKCDAILDCAAQTSVTEGEENPSFSIANNTIGVFNILEGVMENKIPLIYCASNKVYPSEKINSLPIIETETRFQWDANAIKNQEHIGLSISETPQGEAIVKGINENWPLGLGARSIYGASKAISDILCQEYQDAFEIPIFVNRFSCLTGPWQYGTVAQGWYMWFIIAAYLGLPITYYGWNGKQVRDVLFIEDVCDLAEKQLSMALKGKSAGGVYTIGGGIQNAISLREHVEMMESAGLKPIVKNESAPKRRQDQVIYISDIGKAQEEFGWSPKVSIDAGFKECLSWVEENSGDLEGIYKDSK